ncbi:MAG: metal ABC transporter permease [Candidatus Omnitrophota bacterium]
MLGVAAFIIFSLHLFFFKEFIFVSFDRETAMTTRLKANLLDFLLYLTIGIMISLSMKICGVIFVFASLVIPAMVGLLMAKSIVKIFLCSILTAIFCLIIGLLISYIWDLPSGPTVVGLYGLVFIILSAVKTIFKKR